jgi:hypothetical protein
MKPNRALLAVAAAFAAACAQPEKPIDASREDVQMLEKHVEQRAAKLLAPGERLAVDITDVDRAGRPEPWRTGSSNVRVVRDVYPPRIALSFRLTAADGTALKQGERMLSAPLPVAAAAVYGEDPLRYERALLDEWLERELRRPGGLK